MTSQFSLAQALSIPSRPKAFISYSRKDAKPFSKRLYDDLKGHGIDAWLDLQEMPSGDTFITEVDRAIQRTDYFLLVFTPGAIQSDFCRDEWKKALEHYKPIIPLLLKGDYSDLPKEVNIQQNDARDFSREENYDEELARLISQLSIVPRPPGSLPSAPDLPRNYLARQVQLGELRRILTAHKTTVLTSVTKKVGVEGMGGVGKSVIAAALTRDYFVRRSFPDGVFWLSFGTEPSLVQIWIRARDWLGGNRKTFTDAMEARDFFAKQTADKECLFILDDVWESEHARAFTRLGDKCRLLVTSRYAKVLDEIDAHSYKLGLLSDEEAHELLMKNAEIEAGDLPEAASGILKACGNLPLALAMIGAMVRGKPESYWNDALDALLEADLESIAARFPEYPYPNLFAAIEISIRALSKELCEHYYDFAIFPDDVPIPETTLLTLWNPMPPRNARQIINELVQRNLLKRENDGSLTIHDLQLAFIRKAGNDVQVRHKRLLANYNSTKRPWHEIPNDGYLYDYLAYHLSVADLYEDLRSLFLDDEWEHARVKQSGYLYERYLSDISITWDIAHRRATNTWNDQYFVDCSRYALITEKISDLSSDYIPELVVRSLQLGIQDWTVDRALSIASRIVDSEQRTYFFVKLLSSGLFESKQREVCVESAISSIEEILFDRAPSEMVRRGIEKEIYVDLARNIRSEQVFFRRLLDALFQEDQDHIIAEVIAQIGQYIPDELLDPLLEKILKLEYDLDWGSLLSKALGGLVGRLSAEQINHIKNYQTLDDDTQDLIERFLNGSEDSGQETSQDQSLPADYDEFIDKLPLSSFSLFDTSLSTLQKIAGNLSIAQVDRLVEKTLTFEDNFHPSGVRHEIFEILAQYLSEEIQLKMLNKAIDIENGLGIEFLSILEAIVTHLTSNSIYQAYKLLKTKTGFERDGFRILAPALEETLLIRALKDSTHAPTPPNVIAAMARFLPYLPPDRHRDIIKQIQSYIGGMDRGAYQKEELLEKLTDANIQDIDVVVDLVYFIFDSNLFLTPVMPLLASLSYILQRFADHPSVVQLIEELDNRLRKMEDRDKSYAGIYIFSLMLKRLGTSNIEGKDRLREEIEGYSISLLKQLLESGSNLRPFFCAILVLKDHLRDAKLDKVLSMILRCDLDYSNTGDLTFFSDFAPYLSHKTAWLENLIDNLIKIRHGNNTNAPLLRALIPAFSDNPQLLYKALHYANSLSGWSSEDRVVTLIHIASYLSDGHFRSHLIREELQKIREEVQNGLHVDHIRRVAGILESCGTVLFELQAEFDIFVALANDLPDCFSRCRVLASVGDSRYFDDDVRMQLRLNTLNSLREVRKNSIVYILSYPSFLKHLQLAPATISSIYETLLEIEEQWEWL